MAQSSMLHVRVDDQLKAEASAKLAAVGLTLSDAVRILLTRITVEGGLPVGLTADPSAYDAWFKQKVREALATPDDGVAHDDVMASAQAIIDRKSRGENRMESEG
ncbi:type II toxin-antitoxin system RelB/DinJ family antitoxin [Pseudidiomarina mangrovi]|uniref:type II toxin-antitoxin system RelB/DinJ family antitoxin n=1 Tax=Pseudidiomarina mangrovi TaxID=2487133 RepID=UPI000FCC5329|nr:type II toxin-antitoxin system RelB/DinJ family antitoxin [Pseudidiomarina mangrovi]